VVSAASVGGSGCSTTNPTELVPGIMSQVVVPHDLQAVRVTVQANGKTEFDQGYDVGTNGAVQLPSTLGVVSGTSAGTVVTITVRGYETPCEESDDCNELGDMPVGTGGARILRRSIQTFVDQHTLFVPMPLSYSCWNTDCGDESMGCKGNTCTTAETLLSTLVDFDPSLIDGTDLCFSPAACFGDMPDGGKNAAIAPLVVDAAACKYAFPGPASESLNVRLDPRCGRAVRTHAQLGRRARNPRRGQGRRLCPRPGGRSRGVFANGLSARPRPLQPRARGEQSPCGAPERRGDVHHDQRPAGGQPVSTQVAALAHMCGRANERARPSDR
jgi:hypothetical protein